MPLLPPASLSPPVTWPLNQVLDDFNRTNESPLRYNGRWSDLNSLVQMSVTSNTCAPVSSASAGAIWNPQTFTAFEVYCTVTTFSTGLVQLWARMADVTLATFDGYLFRSSTSAQTILRVDNGSGSTIASNSLTMQNSDLLLFRGIGVQLEAYFRRAGNWTRIFGVADGAYTSGFIGIGGTVTAQRLDDFGGGEITNPNIAPPIEGFGAC